MRASRFSMVPLVASLLVLFSSCTDTGTGPGVGSGTLLEADVNGTRLTLDVSSDISGFNSYTVSTNYANFGGTLVGSPSKTITLAFTYDLNNGPFPKTLTGSNVSINYIEAATSGNLIYNCPIAQNTCSVTITGSDGETVDGTFQASLSENSDSTKKVTITNGTFSVKLTRK